MDDPDELLKIDTSAEAGATVVVRLAGELDISNAGVLRSQLMERIGSGARGVVIDVRHLTFIDSTGIATLIAAHQAASAEGGTVEVRNAAGTVRRAMEIVGVDQIMAMSDDAPDDPSAPDTSTDSSASA